MDKLTCCSTSELVAACQRGDGAAWCEFVERFNRRVMLFVLREYRACGEATGDVGEVVRALTNEVYLRLVANGCGGLRDAGGDGDVVLLAHLARTARVVVREHAGRLAGGGGGRLPPSLDEPGRRGRPGAAGRGSRVARTFWSSAARAVSRGRRSPR